MKRVLRVDLLFVAVDSEVRATMESSIRKAIHYFLVGVPSSGDLDLDQERALFELSKPEHKPIEVECEEHKGMKVFPFKYVTELTTGRSILSEEHLIHSKMWLIDA